MTFVRTIGVYGTTSPEFFESLVRAGVTDFCDVRARRGVRGARYAFANAVRLVEALEARGIRYHHWKDVAPDPELRAAQHREDAAERTAKRERARLSPAFVAGYTEQLASRAWLVEERITILQRGGACLFCVETAPDACHRSILAEEIAQRLGLAVRHL